jgi:hypothetical protein
VSILSICTGSDHGELEQIAAAVEAIAQQSSRFKGSILVLPNRQASRATVRVALERHPDFAHPHPRGLRVAWMVEPVDGGQDTRQDQRRMEYAERLREVYPGWDVYEGYTLRQCVCALAANNVMRRGFSVKETVWRRCQHCNPYLRGDEPAACPSACPANLGMSLIPVAIPDGILGMDISASAFTDADGADDDFDDNPLLTAHACPAMNERKGPHGYRVMPMHLIWGDVSADPAAPHTANIVVLDGKLQPVKWWSPWQLEEVATDKLLTRAAPLLKALADVANRLPEQVPSHGSWRDELSGLDLDVQLRKLLPNLDAVLTTWRLTTEERARACSVAAVYALPRNPTKLIDALIDDIAQSRAAAGTLGAAFLPRVRVRAGVVELHTDPRDIPPMLAKVGTIDFTGWALANADELRGRGHELLTPADVLARVAPKRERQHSALMACLVAACERLDTAEADKTMRAIGRAAGVKHTQVMRHKDELAGAYGGEWVSGPRRSLVLVGGDQRQRLAA